MCHRAKCFSGPGCAGRRCTACSVSFSTEPRKARSACSPAIFPFLVPHLSENPSVSRSVSLHPLTFFSSLSAFVSECIRTCCTRTPRSHPLRGCPVKMPLDKTLEVLDPASPLLPHVWQRQAWRLLLEKRSSQRKTLTPK